MSLIDFLKTKIKQGIDRNIMVLDHEAASGELTPRLLRLMVRCFSENEKNGDYPIVLFAGDELTSAYLPVITLLDLIYKESLNNYYADEMNGTFPGQKTNLCILMGKTNVLLGAY